MSKTGAKDPYKSARTIMKMLAISGRVRLRARYRAWNAMQHPKLCEFYRYSDWVIVVDPEGEMRHRVVVTCYKSEAYRFEAEE